MNEDWVVYNKVNGFVIFKENGVLLYEGDKSGLTMELLEKIKFYDRDIFGNIVSPNDLK